jgi:hypothetical protein
MLFQRSRPEVTAAVAGGVPAASGRWKCLSRSLFRVDGCADRPLHCQRRLGPRWRHLRQDRMVADGARVRASATRASWRAVQSLDIAGHHLYRHLRAYGLWSGRAGKAGAFTPFKSIRHLIGWLSAAGKDSPLCRWERVVAPICRRADDAGPGSVLVDQGVVQHIAVSLP